MWADGGLFWLDLSVSCRIPGSFLSLSFCLGTAWWAEEVLGQVTTGVAVCRCSHRYVVGSVRGMKGVRLRRGRQRQG